MQRVERCVEWLAGSVWQAKSQAGGPLAGWATPVMVFPAAPLGGHAPFMLKNMAVALVFIPPQKKIFFFKKSNLKTKKSMFLTPSSSDMPHAHTRWSDFSGLVLFCSAHYYPSEAPAPGTLSSRLSTASVR